MKWTLIYQLTAMVATAVATADDSEPVETRERDASGLNFVDDLAKRGLDKRSNTLYCGNFANGDRGNLRALYDDLGSETYFAPGRGCIRAKCWNTSGIYVCNDNAGGLKLDGYAIKRRMGNIQNNCCTAGAFKKVLSGQQFTNESPGNWNVVVGYANCKQDKYTKPSDAGGYGVNQPQCPNKVVEQN